MSIDWNDIVEIRQKAARGMKTAAIAREYQGKISRRHVYRIVSGEFRSKPREVPTLDALGLRKLERERFCIGCGNPTVYVCRDGKCLNCNVRKLERQGLVKIEGAA
jgi:hypothetical protein